MKSACANHSPTQLRAANALIRFGLVLYALFPPNKTKLSYGYRSLASTAILAF